MTEQRVCANDRCQRVYAAVMPHQIHCSRRCGNQTRQRAYYRRGVGADYRGYRTGILADPKPVKPNGRTCRRCGSLLVGLTRSWCSEPCRKMFSRWGDGGPPTPTQPNCWAWTTIHRELAATDRASLGTLALAVYGEDTKPNRDAMSATMRQLAGARKPDGRLYYHGAPWVALARRGWWALPGSSVWPSRSDLLRLLARRPRTVEDIAARMGIAPRTAEVWIGRLKADGHLVERAVRLGGGARWRYVYWIGAAARARVCVS